MPISRSVPSPTHLEHHARAVLEVDDRERQRRDERRRHRLVHDERVDDAAAGERHELELRAAARDAVRVDRRRRVDRAAVGAARAEQPSISSAPRTNSALSGGTPIGMVSPDGDELAAGAQHLGVRTRPPVRDRGRRPRPRPGPVPSTVIVDAGGPAAAGADDRDGAGGVERADRAEERRRGAGVAELRRRRRPTRASPTPSCFATVAPRRPSGSGSDHARASSAARCSPTSRTVGRNISSRNSRGS